jgi:hypothetical protein
VLRVQRKAVLRIETPYAQSESGQKAVLSSYEHEQSTLRHLHTDPVAAVRRRRAGRDHPAPSARLCRSSGLRHDSGWRTVVEELFIGRVQPTSFSSDIEGDSAGGSVGSRGSVGPGLSGPAISNSRNCISMMLATTTTMSCAFC